MKQLTIIQQLKTLFPQIQGIEIALLYGSFARNERNPNSDIDIQLIVNEYFEVDLLKKQLKKTFESEIQIIREVSLRNKIVCYFKEIPKLEIGIYHHLSEITRNYLGSEICEVENSILYEKNAHLFDLKAYLIELISTKTSKNTTIERQKNISSLIDKFIYEFESCSTAHKRSDGYKFYFFYNLALHIAIQLNQLSKGESKFNFLPKNLIVNVLNKKEQATFYDLKGTLLLSEANIQKRRLLDFFFDSIQSLVSAEKNNELCTFCEWIYERDIPWNFRDISLLNPRIKKGVIYRTATMSLFQQEPFFENFVAEKKIKTIVDLRADREIAELPYIEHQICDINYIKAQFDPWNQPKWFKESQNFGTNVEIAYRFFVMACKDSIKMGIEAILNEKNGAVAVHCFAGKDRTGIFVSLLHLLVDTPLSTIYEDYLASENDVKLPHLEMCLQIIEKEGGIIDYLLSCGLTEIQITQFKHKLQYGNK